ncbi:hypothetical protein [Sinorhizobium medicae]
MAEIAADARNKSIWERWAERAAFLAVLGSVFYGGYWLGSNPTSEQTKIYQSFLDLDLPARIKDANAATDQLRKASTEFSTMLANNRTYEDMRSRFGELVAERDALKKESQAVAAEVATLGSRLAELTDIGKSYTIRENSAVPVVGALLNVGARSIGPSGDVELIFNGVKKTSFPGDRFHVDAANGKKCLVRVHDVDYVGLSQVDISVDCTDALK